MATILAVDDDGVIRELGGQSCSPIGFHCMSWGLQRIWSCSQLIKTGRRGLAVHEELQASPFSLNTFSGGCCYDK
jgi:hypothetical protein